MSSSGALPREREGIADKAFDRGDPGMEVLQRFLLAKACLGDAGLRIEHFEQRETALAVALRNRLGRLLRPRDCGLGSTASSRSEPCTES
jgi:hypothetical protein